MLNIRKKLVFLTVLMFLMSIALPLFFGSRESKEENHNVTAEVTIAPEINYTASGIFAGEEERFVAHRGYSAAAPENTALAFELAGKSAFWGIETDICETYDNEFVCMHDDTINRTTNGAGPVSNYTYAEIQTLYITDGANIDKYADLKIPSMVEYLNICVTYGCVPVIEIKHITSYDKFLQTIYDSNLQNNCIVTGGIEDLKEIRYRDKDIALMVIGYSNKEYTFYTDLISSVDGVRGILYNYPVLTSDVVSELHSNGLLCGAWSLDTAEEAQLYMGYGVDFVVTNEIPASTNLMINTNE